MQTKYVPQRIYSLRPIADISIMGIYMGGNTYILFTEYRENQESVASIVTSAVGMSDNAAPEE